MTPGLLMFIEKLRPLLAAGDGGAFRACRDAAQDIGVRLRVLRRRSVNVKKSNRRVQFRNGSILLISNPAGLQSGDWITIAGQRFSVGRWVWPSDAMFEEREQLDFADAARWLEGQARVSTVDIARGTITIIPGLPPPPPVFTNAGRVPGHVAANRARLDGRRR